MTQTEDKKADLAMEACTDEDDGKVNLGGNGSSGIILQDFDHENGSAQHSMTVRDNEHHQAGPSGPSSATVMSGIGTQRHAGNRVVQSHEKKFIASKNKD